MIDHPFSSFRSVPVDMEMTASWPAKAGSGKMTLKIVSYKRRRKVTESLKEEKRQNPNTAGSGRR